MRTLIATSLAACLVCSTAIAQTSTTTITTDQQSKVKTYVMKEKPASVKVTETVAVGAALPSSVTLHTLPADVGVQYRYAIVNDKTVLVEPTSRKIIQVIE
ncbi:glucose/arabinose dehydrogenase [Bosea sp. OAE752]|jgi:glucose/arabinose dehydrogenase|uniref:DUF1236 domain-containing protein n=1 Tax=Bosea spartocytisi TaxID=2773451 RepID=A0A927E5V3_9HYPH|nr:DUF1236 domain-containing protein [Bosea spartocytisi]MBD3844657.1 DUF1236 domain-containing protein [Bosea spartocytisi]MCT4470860.1 DUF1236 domain-containing protein [Bosea spartocytisi]